VVKAVILPNLVYDKMRSLYNITKCNNHASWVKTEGLGLRVLPVPLPTTMPHLQEGSKTYKSVDKSTKKTRKRQEGNLVYKLGI